LKIEINSIFAVPKGKDGVVAQLVEQRTENPCVGGSIPLDTTSWKAYRKWYAFFFIIRLLRSVHLLIQSIVSLTFIAPLIVAV
jgi:hypothetical protein